MSQHDPVRAGLRSKLKEKAKSYDLIRQKYALLKRVDEILARR
jgi:hypothetical protein